MAHPDVTLSTETIHNPAEPRHYMRVKPVSRRVRVTRGGRTLVDTREAMRVTEIARDVIDPVFYFRKGDIAIDLATIPGKTTHCPLKGDATYYSADGSVIAWSYDAPLDFADAIKGLVAFYPDEVTIEEIGEG